MAGRSTHRSTAHESTLAKRRTEAAAIESNVPSANCDITAP
jgi:hypothetical protein